MKKHLWKRLTAFLLVLTLTFTSFDLPVLATAVGELMDPDELMGEVIEEPATILCEDEMLREESVKTFIMSDLTKQAVVYSMPVHYEEDGEWKDIDNTLEND